MVERDTNYVGISRRLAPNLLELFIPFYGRRLYERRAADILDEAHKHEMLEGYVKAVLTCGDLHAFHILEIVAVPVTIYTVREMLEVLLR